MNHQDGTITRSFRSYIHSCVFDKTPGRPVNSSQSKWKAKLVSATGCLFGTLSSLGATPCSDAPRPTLDQLRDASRVLSEFAQTICSSVKTSGSTSQYLGTAEAKAQLSGLAKHLVDIGIDISGSATGTSFDGVSQKDLPGALNDNANCKLRVIEMFRDNFFPSSLPSKVSTDERTVTFSSDTPGVMQEQNGHRIDMGDGGGGTRFEKWLFKWPAPGRVISVKCTPARNEHVLAENALGTIAECDGKINGGNDPMTMHVVWEIPCPGP